MANTGYTSPFPTSHDTIGQSTLVTPLFMPSSPPQHQTSPSPPGSPLPNDSPISGRFEPENRVNQNSHEHQRDDQHERENQVQRNHQFSGSRSPTGADLDARLAEYTLDFSRFPSGHLDDVPLPEFNDEEDKLSDVGGPHDFTANMEKYLMGEDVSNAREARSNDGPAEQNSGLRHSSIRSRQPAVEEAESGDYSEFGPPVDMSTPSHMLNRHSGFAKDSTQLDDIEEDPADNSQLSASPSLRKISNVSEMEGGEREEWLHRRIAHLEEEIRHRDTQIQTDRNRLLEADSAEDQIHHLQTELQQKVEYIEDMKARDAHDEGLHDQIDALKKEREEREGELQHFKEKQSDLSSLQQQLHDMQQKFHSQDSQSSLDTERLETIAHLRQQLNIAQDQLKKRDETLDETMTKLREVTRAKEAQLHEKNGDIDRLKADMDDQALENERLETEIDHVKSAYQTLEDRLTGLETKNEPLKARNQSLEADLTRAQYQVEAQENALKAVAADLPRGSRSTYSEILDLIQDLGPPGSPSEPGSPVETRTFGQHDIHSLGDEVLKLRQELQEANAAHKAAEAEANRLRDQATESQTFVQNIEAENSQLTKRVDELTATLTKTQRELTQTKEDHAESLETIARLQEEALDQALEQPPSPPPSPPQSRDTPHPAQQQINADLEEVHQAQIKSLQTAHSTAISTLRSSHAESMRKIRGQVTAAEKREAELRVELTTIRTSASSNDAQQRKALKAEIKRLEAVIVAKDEAAVELDHRVASSVDKRESEWERRVNIILKERDRLAKALMQTWGEKEMGTGPGGLADGKEKRRRDGEKVDAKGQAYRYRYVQRTSSKSKEKTSDQ